MTVPHRIAVTHKIPPWVACVLHYESSTYSKWRQKYLELAARHGCDEQVLARVPFNFYKLSMTVRCASGVAEGAV